MPRVPRRTAEVDRRPVAPSARKDLRNETRAHLALAQRVALTARVRQNDPASLGESAT